eukprot:CAMPEP_0197533502 /NCGR_PEP_ID=MMETSP1318-20131121/43676_1 /TAXON_ID=552666 /ORGANISM="Partenskyella glossopodia, Strain RCC365" /LENGTH=212 /DNA_ID=CAMNT_0043090417 /DNA_START=106 /DNA_END=744 /DNA_ORIENTATION=-
MASRPTLERRRACGWECRSGLPGGQTMSPGPYKRYPNGVPFTVAEHLVKRGVQDREWLKVIHRHPKIQHLFMQKCRELNHLGIPNENDCRATYMREEYAVEVPCSSDSDVEGGQNKLFVSLNYFPYHWESDALHFVMWTDSPNLELKYFEDVALGKFPAGFDMILWINDMSMRSIPGILHAHLLVKPHDESSPGSEASREPSRILASSRMTR